VVHRWIDYPVEREYHTSRAIPRRPQYRHGNERTSGGREPKANEAEEPERATPDSDGEQDNA